MTEWKKLRRLIQAAAILRFERERNFEEQAEAANGGLQPSLGRTRDLKAAQIEFARSCNDLLNSN